jgi:hypothetical protein
LEDALEAARANVGTFSIINIQLDPKDRSPALQRFGKRLSVLGGRKRAPA